LRHARKGVAPHSTAEALSTIAARLEAEPYAAMVIEPMVQGAAGMRMMPVDFVQGLAALCREHGALLVADEVMTAFGRTGRMFALEHAGVSADLICLSKGISGGTLPVAATLASEPIYETFLDEDMRRGFLHGHTYTANPIACAAGLASLELFEKEGALERAAGIEAFYARRLPSLNDHPAVDHTRWLGTIGVVELASGQAGYYNPAGKRVQEAMLERGYLVRPLGPVAYTMPPLCATDDDLGALYDAFVEVLDGLS
jgi:adenosylmethionine-8-amino-7-oxononanoate aminotransferase